jgi:hypothetical protein
MGNTPQVAKPELNFGENFYVEFGVSGQPNFIWSNVTPGIQVFRVDGTVQATGPLLLDTLKLEIGGYPLDPIGWHSYGISGGATWLFHACFKTPKGIGSGRHMAKLTVNTDNGPWSPKSSFPIEFP